jgi:hypothetical protein
MNADKLLQEKGFNQCLVDRMTTAATGEKKLRLCTYGLEVMLELAMEHQISDGRCAPSPSRERYDLG